MLLAALAASLGSRLGEDGELPEEIHAMVPVNLRPPDRPVPAELGNDFALILLELPLAEMRPAERLRQVNSRMNSLKASHEAPISFGLLSAIGKTPPWVEGRLIEFFTEKASMVVTNVPGPSERLSFAGAPSRRRPRLGALLGQPRPHDQHLQLRRRGQRRLHGRHRADRGPGAARRRLRGRARAALSLIAAGSRAAA